MPEAFCPVFFFHPGGDTEGSTDFDDTVRTKYSFTVKYDMTYKTNNQFYCAALSHVNGGELKVELELMQ